MIDHLALESLVKKAANAACVNFPSHYDASDVEQTLWLWVFEKKNTVEDIIRNTERPEGTLYNLMTKEANSYLKKEDAVSQRPRFWYGLSWRQFAALTGLTPRQ